MLEDQTASTTADQTSSPKPTELTIKPENQINLKPEDNIDWLSIKPDNQIAREPVDSIVTSSIPTVERDVNLCCKVPESWRRHWAAESKRGGLTMTDVIVEAFTAKFGLPTSQNTKQPE